MGLTQAVITKIIASVMEMDVVSEVGIIASDDNRRSIGLRLDADKHQVIGVKFARQMFAVGMFDILGKIHVHTETKFPLEEDPQKMLSTTREQTHDMLEKYKNVVPIGLAVPGPYLRNEGHIAIVTQIST